MAPLVSVICLCYNQKQFVREAVLSVVNQYYDNIEIIVVDDCSSDGSAIEIDNLLIEYPEIHLIRNEVNLGNCKSFNKGFAISRGSFIIDFACDDIMLPERVKDQVRAFENLNEDYGVVYTNAEDIDEHGKFIKYHYSSEETIPSGDVYSDVVANYFISPPTMMTRRSVFEKLNGYDETLSYEDYDFWVRSARIYKYYYLNKILTKRRSLKYSHSNKFNWRKNNPMVDSTYRVILKAAWLNKNEMERSALLERVRYELRHSSYIGNSVYVEKYFFLLKSFKGVDVRSKLVLWLSRLNGIIPLFYRLKLKFSK